MGKLTLFWGNQSDKSFYWRLSGSQPDGAIPQLQSQQILKADLACIAEMAAGNKVELVISNDDVHINSVELPNKAQRHLRKAVPFLLEEQIASPVDEVFFAVGSRAEDGKIPVRAIRQSYLQALISEFAEAEISLEWLRTDLDLLGSPEEGMQVLVQGHHVWVADDKQQRWSCDLDNFAWLVQKQLTADSDVDELPVAIPLKVLCQDEQQYQDFCHQLPAGRFAPQSEISDDILQSLLDFRAPMFNLLQGEYEPKAENSELTRLLRKVASISGFVLIAWLGFQASHWYELSAQSEYLQKQKEALYKQAFPTRKITARTVNTMDKDRRAFIKSLGGAVGDAGFLAMLQSTSGQMQDMAQLYPTNISYNSARNELRMDVIAKDLSILNQYRDRLTQNGHQVDMSSATQRGDGYSSRLTIRRL